MSIFSKPKQTIKEVYIMTTYLKPDGDIVITEDKIGFNDSFIIRPNFGYTIIRIDISSFESTEMRDEE